MTPRPPNPMRNRKEKNMSKTLTKKQHAFISKQPNYQLWIEQPHDLRDEYGKKYGQTPLKAVIFENNRFVVTDESAEAVGMTYDELIDWIRSHETINAEVWDEGAAPDEQSPTFKERSDAIFAAVAKLDPDAVAAIRDDELATHNRGGVIQMCVAALEQLQSEGETEDE